MLAKKQMQEIQDLKLQGYTKTDIIRYYEALGTKPPSRLTINKYYDMDVVPENPGAKLAKERTFDAEPFRSTIISILESNNGKDYCMSSVYDVLEEKFIENGDFEKLPGNEQTLRNYIHHLEDICMSLNIDDIRTRNSIYFDDLRCSVESGILTRSEALKKSTLKKTNYQRAQKTAQYFHCF